MKNKKQLRIILLMADPSFWSSILDRLEYLKFDNFVKTFFPEEALIAASQGGPCVIITESFSHGSTPKTKEVAELAVECKKKNPDCNIILFTRDHWDIDTKLFDVSIAAATTTPKDSLTLLFEAIEYYAQK